MVRELFLIKQKNVCDVYITIMNIVLIIFSLNCFTYIYFINWLLVFIIFIARLNFEKIKVISEFVFVQQRLSFWSVHHNDKIRTYIILLSILSFIYFWILILISHALHCLKVPGTIIKNIVACQWFLIWLDMSSSISTSLQ